MRRLLATISVLICVAIGACSQESDVSEIEAVDDVVGRLDEAFEARDTATIKALMTADHIAVTPYYAAALSVDEVLASLDDLTLTQTDLSEPEVVLLGPGVAMRTQTAKVEGSFKGRAFSDTVFATAVLVKRDGKWLEQFYQATHFAP